MGRAQVWAEPVLSLPCFPFHLCLSQWWLLGPTFSLRMLLCSEDGISLWEGHWAPAWQWLFCGGCAGVTLSPAGNIQLLQSSYRGIPAELLWDRKFLQEAPPQHFIGFSVLHPAWCSAVALSSP